MIYGSWNDGLNDAGRTHVDNLGPGFFYSRKGGQDESRPAPEGAEWPNLWDTGRLVLHPAEENSPLRVMMLQTFLNSQGAGLSLTGEFDEATEAAVRAFQKTAGIPQHGVVGTETIQSMLDTWQQPLPKPRPEPTPPPLPKPNPMRADPSAAFQPAPGFAQSPAEVPRPGPVAGSAGIPATTPGFGQAIGAVPGWAELAAGAGFRQLAALAAYQPKAGAPGGYASLIENTPVKPRGLLDVEAMEEEERNAAQKAARTALRARSADSGAAAKGLAALPEADPAAPMDSDPIDVWMEKRWAQLRRRGAPRPAASTELSDDLPIEEWMRRRNAQASGRSRPSSSRPSSASSSGSSARKTSDSSSTSSSASSSSSSRKPSSSGSSSSSSSAKNETSSGSSSSSGAKKGSSSSSSSAKKPASSASSSAPAKKPPPKK